MAESNEQRWFCLVQGATSGPFSLDELKFLVQRGRVLGDTPVRQGKAGKWAPARAVGGLFDAPRTSATMAATAPAGPAISKPVEPQQQAAVPAAATVVSASPAADTRSVAPPTPPPVRTVRRRRIVMGAVAGAGIALVAILLISLWLRRAADRDHSDTVAAVVPSGSSDNVDIDDPDPIQPAAPAESPPTETEPTDAASDPQAADAGEIADASAAASDEVDETEAAPKPKPLSTGLAELNSFPTEPQPKTDADQEAFVNRSRPTTKIASRMFGERSSQRRARAVRRGGGSAESEEAVELGLKWLADHQSDDGRWSLDEFHTVDACHGECSDPGTNSDIAATGLALLPFLAAGYTHEGPKKYQATVQRALDWLVADQNTTGEFRSLGSGNMYAQAQATIAVCEALALTSDRRLREPAQLAVDYIVKAQHMAGGWRYSPGSPGDTSVFGWQILALFSAKSARLDVPKQTLSAAVDYLDSARADKLGSQYAYMPGGGPGRPAMTAEGLLCRQYLGWERDNDGMQAGVDYLLTILPSPDNLDMYYVYYATQVVHHYGGKEWDRWNAAMLEALLKTQVRVGHETGSWTPGGNHDQAGGRVYMTALALCTLEVYYRHGKLYGD